jgi:uncharacterized protein (DUF111 family)
VTIPQSNETSTASRKGALKLDRDIVAVVETNVDDVTGEILSQAIERLFEEGAYDVSTYSYHGKKGRVGHTVRIVCSTDSIEKFVQILIEETGTLGVKVWECTRFIVPRKTISIPVSIENFHGNVNVKVAEFGGKILRVKPEISEVKQIAEKEKITVREALFRVSTSAQDFLQKSTRENKESVSQTKT